MAKVHIRGESSGNSPVNTGKLRKFHETTAEHVASQVSLVNTVEAMQAAVEEFSEHVEGCNVPFK